MRLIGVLTCVVLVAACSRPYVIPETENPDDVRTKGIQEVLAEGTPVHLISIHGMCTHSAQGSPPENWVLDRVSLVSERLGAEARFERVERVGDPSRPQVEVYWYSYQGIKARLTHALILWSPLTAPAKRDLEFDAPRGSVPGGEFDWKRAWLNGALKVGLINDCFADAVVYSGREFSRIHTTLKQAVCVSMGGAVSNAGRCSFPMVSNASPQIVFATESLGSKLLFDALVALLAEADGPTLQAMLDRLAGDLIVFMLANQIPLLNLARETGEVAAGGPFEGLVQPAPGFSTGDSLEQVLRALLSRPPIEAAIQPRTRSVTLVAFTDPNDLLSYRLSQKYKASFPARVWIVNVIVSNDYTYFGYVERPDTAHSGYRANKTTMDILLCGIGGPKCGN